MPRKTYVTKMPDKKGAFLLASKIIAGYSGNIVRASYNKAVDLHTLFIDVEADSDEALSEIAQELQKIGYLGNDNPETRVLVVVIQIPDRPGAILPVLEILDRYEINISYMNSHTGDSDIQHFKMGLLIEKPTVIQELLGRISRIYPIDVTDYDDAEIPLDNTIFYIRLANSMQRLLGLRPEQTVEFISESNRILQEHQEKGENPDRVFDYIRRFAGFVSAHQGSRFRVDVEKLSVGDRVTLYSIQPPCGSNTVVLDAGEELVMIDSGYAIYADEMFRVFDRLFRDWRRRLRRVYITHADVDHCGLLAKLGGGVSVCLNLKSADSLRRQYEGLPDFREKSDIGFAYSRLSRIISGYAPPDPGLFAVIDTGTPPEHDELLSIGSFEVTDLTFEVLEGSGGHLYGEEIFVCREHGLIFTGDNLVNISGFSPERAEFNSLAPYLMKSVNVDSAKATKMRKDICRLIDRISDQLGRPCIICGAHGVFSVLRGGKIANYGGAQQFEL